MCSLRSTMVVKVFFSYAHEDEALRDTLETHLALLKNQGVIQVWHDRQIGAGQEFDSSIDGNLNSADIILLLISPDFLASPYCWGVEVKRAIERHEAKSARVIPVILRACDWQSAPFGKLLAAPRDGKPIKSWPDRDEAFYDVARQIRAAAEAIASRTSGSKTNEAQILGTSLRGPPRIYCSRCGSLVGNREICTGSYTHHNFLTMPESGVYCSRCGTPAGTKSICTGSYTYHNFVKMPQTGAYCSRCGALAGTKSVCTGSHTYHNFVSLV